MNQSNENMIASTSLAPESHQTTEPPLEIQHSPVSTDLEAEMPEEGSDQGTEEEDDSGSAWDSASQTSTIEHEQEPYETYKDKVQQLLLQLYPGHTVDDFTIERMRGGGFNRIIGIEVRGLKNKKSPIFTRSMRRILQKCLGQRPSQASPPVGQLILRIPRTAQDAAAMHYHVAALKVVAANMRYPTPKVVSYAMSQSNPLEQPYMIQERLPGQPLHQLFIDGVLTLEQKKSVVRQIVQIALDISKVTHDCPGIVSSTNTVLQLQEGVKLETFPVPSIGRRAHDNFRQPNTFPAKPQTTTQFLLSLSHRWRQYERSIYGHAQEDTWDRLVQIIKKLHELGFLPDEDKFHLCHMDFQARNILVVLHKGNIKVTGVLDWDSAVFGPKFLSKRAPFFIWDGECADEEDENNALVVPETAEEKEFKAIFEEMADEEFLRFAYQPEYIIARRIFHVLNRGIHSGRVVWAANEIIEDLQGLHPLPELPDSNELDSVDL
jgi:hypothetical protein